MNCSMSDQPHDPGQADHTDIEVTELDVAANTERPESNDPDAFTDDGTLGGLGGSDAERGGAG